MEFTVIKPTEKLIEWLKDRIEYYSYEDRYATNDKTKEIIEAKKTEATEILDKIKDALA